MDLDGDGEYERIIGCTSGARVNTISYVMDIYDDNLHFTEIPVQVPVKYESYSSNTIGLMIEGKEPLYFDGFLDTTSIDGFQRKYGNYKVITRNAGITEWDCLKYSKINGEYILCQPVCAGFAGGTAGGITIYAHYRYHDGEIELVEYDY